MNAEKQVRDFLEPVAECAEQDTLNQVLDMIGAGNPVAVPWLGRWRLLLPDVAAGCLPNSRVIDLPLSEVPLLPRDLPVEEALAKLAEGRAGYALVVDGERLLGMVAEKRLREYPDVCKRDGVEDTPRENEARYRSLFENSFDGVLLTVPDGRILAANPEACRILGRSEDELRQVGRAGVVDVTDPRLAALLEERSRTGKCRGELTYLRGDGTTFEGEISSAVFTDRNGAPRTSMIIRDITERKRAEEALRQRTRQLEVIHALTTEITRELDPTALLRLITQQAAELVGVASGTVWLWDEEAQMLVPKAWHASAGWRGEVRLRLGEGVTGTVAQRREGLIVNDYRTSPYALSFFLDRLDFTAVMGEPLMYRERLLGVLIIDNTGTGRFFTEEDREALALFASQAAIAIENARLHEGTRRHARQLAALNEVTRSLTMELDPQRVAQKILGAIRVLIPDTTGQLWECDESSGTLHLVAMAPREPGADLQREFQTEEGLAGLAVAKRQPVISQDVTQDPRFVNRGWAVTERLVSCISLPLISRDRIQGALVILTRSPHRFTDEELDYLQSFSARAAVAIENARLFQSVSDQHAQLRTLTARLADAGEMQRQRLSRDLHDCVGGNLTALNLNLSIVQSQLQAQGIASAATRIQESMRLVEEAVQHIRSVMTELRPPLLDDQGLVACLHWYTDQFSARTSVACAVRGEDPRPRLPRSAEIALFRIAQEVLTNVAKHAQAREVTLMLEDTTEKVQLTVADDGVGFDPATVRPHGEQSWWGLITMRERAVAIGGSLRVESAPGSGTRVIVEVPR